jgi:hypothetical protein
MDRNQLKLDIAGKIHASHVESIVCLRTANSTSPLEQLQLSGPRSATIGGSGAGGCLGAGAGYGASSITTSGCWLLR